MSQVISLSPLPSLALAGEAELLERIGQGDEAALGHVYGLHAGPVFTLARRILRDVQLAEDVVQDVFVRLWDRAHAFDAGRGSLRTYLLVQARSRSLDLLRSEASRRSREGNEGRLVATAERVDQPESVLAVKTDIGDMRRAIDVLSEDQRRTIELAYFGGHTCREVAEMLRIPEGTVKSRIRLGLQRLRLLMAQQAG